MDNTSLTKLKEAISKSQSIGIVVGYNPTIDQMAAALSLYLLLKHAQKTVTIAAPEGPLVEVSSLVGINKVQTSLGGQAGDLVVSFPYAEGEIEKVSYTLEQGSLNIIVKAGEKGLSFDDHDVKFVRGSGEVDLLIVVGTPRLSDIGEIISGDKLRNVKVVNIDTNPENQGYGDIVLQAPQLSSVSEHVGDLVLLLGLPLDQDAAQNLMSGIISATNNFQNSKTSPMAFEIAAVLMKQGAHRKIESTPSAEQKSWGQAQTMQRHPQPPVKPQMQAAQRQPVNDFDFDEELPPQQQRSNDFALPEEKAGDARHPDDQAPVDWLSPKVYKGSSNF